MLTSVKSNIEKKKKKKGKTKKGERKQEKYLVVVLDIFAK